MLRAVFFGTPEFAVPSLARLLEGAVEVPLVVTRPDRPAGRHATPRPSAVALFALSRGLAVAKPSRLREGGETLAALRAVAPDVGVVVAYGRILPRELLELPRLGWVNVHASLLPRYRGASPVQAAILAGDAETGVVTMRVEEELDAGPIYLSRRVPMAEQDDAGSLSARLGAEGAELLLETLRGIEAGTLLPHPQRGTPSFCRPIRREDGLVDWSLTARQLKRRLRAYTPWPGLFTFLGVERIKILAADVGPRERSDPPGAFWLEGGELLAAAGDGSTLLVRRLQRAGRNPVAGAEFAQGARLSGRFSGEP